MVKLLSIDPGKFKCGLVFAEISEQKVYKAIVLKSEILEDYVRNLNSVEDISKIIIGNGTSCDEIKSKGSQVGKINTNGNFVKKIRDFLQENQNIKFKLEVVSLRDSKTAEPIVVEINILKIAS